MQDEPVSLGIGRKLVSEIVAETSGIEAFVIISSIDLDIAKAKRKNRQLSRRQLAKRLKEIPSAQAFCEAVRAGGLTAAKHLADKAAGEPRAVWWCESVEACEQVVAGIYERLARSARRFDAYDFGSCGPLAWIAVWQD